jgi:hypothetical protein
MYRLHMADLMLALEVAPDIEQAIWDGMLSMAGCESAPYFVQQCILDHLLDGTVAGVSTHNFSDNTPTVGWITQHTNGGESPFTEEMLHCLGICQLVTGRGPADCTHWPGKENLMGDIPLCLFEEGFPEGMDEQFLAHFTDQFPLPLPFSPNSQPGSWRLVTPPSRIISAMISLLQKTPNTSEDPTATIGDSGYAIPRLITRTLASSTYKDNPTKWNESSCSWPLLDPSGKVSSTVANLLPLRSSRLCYKKSPGSWTVGGLATLGGVLWGSPSLTHSLQTWSVDGRRRTQAAPRPQQALPSSTIHTIAMTYGNLHSLKRQVTADLVMVAYFFLLRVGEYTPTTPKKGSAKQTTPLQKRDITFWHNTHTIPTDSPVQQLQQADGVTINLANQKNRAKDA